MEIKKKSAIGQKLGKFAIILEPLGILATIVLFTIPTLAVINLSAETKYISATQEVMGTTDTDNSQKDSLNIQLIGGIHQYISSETMEKDADETYTYHAKLAKRDAGSYSKPFITITNNTDSPINIYFTGRLSTDSKSKVGIIYNESNYLIQNTDGEIFKSPISIPSGDAAILYVSVSNDSDVLFFDDLTIRIFSQ